MCLLWAQGQRSHPKMSHTWPDLMALNQRWLYNFPCHCKKPDAPAPPPQMKHICTVSSHPCPSYRILLFDASGFDELCNKGVSSR